MGYHPRIESRTQATFVTTRARNSELWFANNEPVETFALGLLAKVSTRYQIKLFGFSLEGSHYHLPAKFPLLNRSHFARDFNSGLAKAVARSTPNYTGGKLWQRRYSGEMIAEDCDIEAQFFYTVLQPVRDGLVSKISEYPFYNCFHDAVCGVVRKFKLIDYTAYNAAKRYNPQLRVADYMTEYLLKYERLPGYEHLSQHQYRVMMEKKLEEHRLEILRERKLLGKTEFLGRAALLRTVPGTPALNPKVSTINTHRPRVLSKSNERRAAARAEYFSIYYKYKEASWRYLAGELHVEFPPGTYRPPIWLVALPAGPFSTIPRR